MLKQKRTGIYLTDETHRQLEELRKLCGENRSRVISRAVSMLYEIRKYDEENKQETHK